MKNSSSGKVKNQHFESIKKTVNAIIRLDINVKNASILGVVGAGGIGAPLIFSIAKQSWHEVSAMLLGLIVLVLVLEYFSTRLRRKLSVGQ